MQYCPHQFAVNSTIKCLNLLIVELKLVSFNIIIPLSLLYLVYFCLDKTNDKINAKIKQYNNIITKIKSINQLMMSNYFEVNLIY